MSTLLQFIAAGYAPHAQLRIVRKKLLAAQRICNRLAKFKKYSSAKRSEMGKNDTIFHPSRHTHAI